MIFPSIEKNANAEISVVTFLNLIVDKLSRIHFVICTFLPSVNCPCIKSIS